MKPSKILTRIKYVWSDGTFLTQDYFDHNCYAQYRFSDYIGTITNVQRIYET